MSLKSKEVKASSGGVSGGEFLDLLNDPSTTSELLTEFASEFDGEKEISSLSSISEDLLLSNSNVDKILGSEKTFRILLSNYDAAKMFVVVDGVADKICASEALLEIFCNSPFNTDLILSEMPSVFLTNTAYIEYGLLNGSLTYREYLLTSKTVMRIVAEDPGLLSAAFGDYHHRQIMFKDGRKNIADILMRESAHARQWLKSTVAVSVYRNGSTVWTRDCDAYILEASTNYSSSSYSYRVGYFLGDYHADGAYIQTTMNKPLEIAERAKSLYVYNTRNHSSYGVTMWYVPMSNDR